MVSAPSSVNAETELKSIIPVFNSEEGRKETGAQRGKIETEQSLQPAPEIKTWPASRPAANAAFFLQSVRQR